MGFQAEFASYEPLRRLRDSEAVKNLETRFKVRSMASEQQAISDRILTVDDLEATESLDIHYVVAIDGSNLAANSDKSYPGAELCYLTVASVLLDMKKIQKIAQSDFIDPVELRKTEDNTSFESAFPGCNIILDEEDDAKSSLRRVLFEELGRQKIFSNGETLLETYEYLFQSRLNTSNTRPKSPIENFENEDMTYGLGEYICPHSGKVLFSTDAMRIHELMNPVGSSGEMYNQIMSVVEKLCLINILRCFEKEGWLADLKNMAFIVDGPLAIFSVSAWLSSAISKELERINNLQKQITKQDMILIGIEKTGLFCNHFEHIDIENYVVANNFTNQVSSLEIDDSTSDINVGTQGRVPPQSIILIDDKYIKENIKPSKSTKPYGEDTYFGRKFFYKTRTGHRLVPVVCCFNDSQRDLSTCNPNQFPRLKDIAILLDELSSNRYPNSISPLISAHAEAAIPLNLGKRIFEDMARKLSREH